IPSWSRFEPTRRLRADARLRTTCRTRTTTLASSEIARNVRRRGLGDGRRQARRREERDVVPRAAVEREIGEDLADHAAELEPVPREAGGDEHRRGARRAIDDEVLVRRIGEETGLHREHRSVRVRKVAADAFAQHALVLGMARAIHRVGIDTLAAMMVAADLEPRASVRRKAVERAGGYVDVENRKRADGEPLRPQRLGP